MDPCFPVTLSREEEDSSMLKKCSVVVQHQGSLDVLKEVHIVPQRGVVVLVDLRCLFASDLMSNDSFPDFVPCCSPQEVGLVCPCCNRMVPQPPKLVHQQSPQ